ncbi:MAG TPA: cytochrome c [Polyangiaceae bacterium]|nr:cytochrome c [Polyangiaceae bacterium]
MRLLPPSSCLPRALPSRPLVAPAASAAPATSAAPVASVAPFAFAAPVAPLAFAALFALAASVTGCQASGDVREWKASDHEQPEHAPPERQPQGRRQGSPAQVPAQASANPDATATLVELAWKSNCFTCHGPEGKGNGPTGPLVKASDLTRPDWQAATSDEQIAAVIRAGKGKMPKFDLPPDIVVGITKRIRALKGR